MIGWPGAEVRSGIAGDQLRARNGGASVCLFAAPGKQASRPLTGSAGEHDPRTACSLRGSPRQARMRVAIQGAGIAGPTLAFWLRRAGHDVLLVEESPALRRGGYVVDFWGTGYDVAERMGLIPEIRSLGYQVREVRFVDERGRRTGGFDVAVLRRLTGDR